MEQPESQPAGAANTSPPMPNIWRRSVALALFFTLVGPAIGTVGLLLFFDLFEDFSNISDDLVKIFVAGQLIGSPFAALCGVILAVRAAFAGRINILETIGAALAATVVILGIGVLPELLHTGTLPSLFFLSPIADFLIFSGSSLFAAIVCRWLYYWLFWPREKGNAV
jgi:hypothetical protein